MCRMSAKPRVVMKAVFAPRRVSRALVPRVVPSRTLHGGIGSSRRRPRKRRMARRGASSGEMSSYENCKLRIGGSGRGNCEAATGRGFGDAGFEERVAVVVEEAKVVVGPEIGRLGAG